MALKLKLDDAGHVVVRDGRPVYIDDVDNQELAFDAEELRGKISALNTEAKTHRLKAKEFEEKLASFGDADPNAIAGLKKMLEEYGGADGLADLKKKGNVDIEAVKRSLLEAAEAKYSQTVKAYEGKVSELSTALTDKEQQLYKHMVSGSLATSKFVADKLILPPDIVEATFGRHFRIEDGKVVAYLGDDKILSREKMGEPASIDEALAVIVDKYPMKDRIMKAPGGGSGAGGNGGSGNPGGKTMSRSQYNEMAASNPAGVQEFFAKGGTLTD